VTTPLDALADALHQAAAFNAASEAAPEAVVWCDPTGDFAPVLPGLRARVPGLLTYGTYQPDARTGPALWLRAAAARQVPGIAWPSGEPPIIYLPGIGRDVLRGAEDCPAELAPLVWFAVAGCFFGQPKQARDWSLRGFLAAQGSPVGLEVPEDGATRAALARAASRLFGEPVAALRGRKWDATALDGLLVEDPVADILAWMDGSLTPEGDPARFEAFAAVAANSVDGASDRDFVCELAFVIALAGVHLSQWAEEWVIYSTQEFGFLRLPEGFCTGSSIMPQKINPDVLELVRGKSARSIGNLQSLLVLLKGLPTAYNRDLQEDKEAIFDSIDTLEAVLGVAAPLVAGTSFDHARVAASIDRGHLDATSLMEALIAAGVPQRTAHELVGTFVRRAMTRGVSLAELSDQEFLQDYTGWNASLRSALGASRAVERMVSFGSTAPAQVADQIAAWQRRLTARA
jgi:hypothetical protein